MVPNAFETKCSVYASSFQRRIPMRASKRGRGVRVRALQLSLFALSLVPAFTGNGRPPTLPLSGRPPRRRTRIARSCWRSESASQWSHGSTNRKENSLKRSPRRRRCWPSSAKCWAISTTMLLTRWCDSRKCMRLAKSLQLPARLGKTCWRSARSCTEKKNGG